MKYVLISHVRRTGLARRFASSASSRSRSQAATQPPDQERPRHVDRSPTPPSSSPSPVTTPPLPAMENINVQPQDLPLSSTRCSTSLQSDFRPLCLTPSISCYPMGFSSSRPLSRSSLRYLLGSHGNGTLKGSCRRSSASLLLTTPYSVFIELQDG